MIFARIIRTHLVVALSFVYAAEGAPLEWQSQTGHRFANLKVAEQGKVGFTLLGAQPTGIEFTNVLSDVTAAKNRITQNGSGVALGDFDGDGLCDIYFCRLEGANVLYRNLGNWRFEDVTAAAGVGCPDQFSTGALFGDVDGDGKIDLLVNSIGGGTRLFLNVGGGRFQEFLESGLGSQFGAMSMAMGDIDGDGDLELYVANYRVNTFKDAPPGIQRPQTKTVDGKVIVTPEDRFAGVIAKNGLVRLREVGEPDILFVNKGQGRFGKISWTGGAFADAQGSRLSEIPRDWGLSAMFRDMDGDGTPDIYVCNDFFYSPDRVWLNEGGRRFRAAPAHSLREMSMSAMTVDFADINRDGYDDFFVADMLSREHEARHRQRANVALMKDVDVPTRDPNYRAEVIRNTLFLNRGDGTYAEIAQFAGVEESEWTWSAIFLDVDLDGYEDLLIANGNDRDVLDADSMRETAQSGKSVDQHLKDLQKFPRLEVTKLAFRNRGDLTFEEVGAKWGFNTRGISHGMALADLDNDGDLDVVVNNMNSVAGIYRNDSAAPRVAVRLKGNAPNTRGIGAKIKVSGGPVSQSQEMISGGRYLSCDDAIRVFAAGSETNDLQIEVVWRSGLRSVVEHAKGNRVYEVDEALAMAKPAAMKAAPQKWFADASALLKHTHQEDAFDDFQRQPLLPNQLSRLGPGASWFDVNGDGWEDLIIGSGKGGALAIYQNDTKGGFTRLESPGLSEVTIRDQTGIVALRNNGSAAVLVGSANYEDGLTNVGASVRQFSFSANKFEDVVPAYNSSAGPIAAADIDGDGNLDLLVGGRVVAGRWPEAAESRIYKFKAGKFQMDEANSRALEKVRMVSGAMWADLDGDGWVDLILACQWGPVRVFKNEAGVLREVTSSMGLDRLTGCWNGVAVGDLDGDGKLDIVASNWGLNTGHRATATQPARVYYGDLLDRGSVDVIEAEYDWNSRIVPTRPIDVLGAAIPPLRDHYATFRSFGQATIAEAFAPYASRLHELQATTLSSTVFFNRGVKFEAAELPAEAQWAPAFGVNVADFDGDGADDIFLSQNFFDTQLEASRCDAGRGLWLRNAGGGKFIAIPGQEAGVEIYGEQRGTAVCDYNHDGRVDLVVTQNSGETKLYTNVGAKPGLRVILRGPAGNPDGIGAQMRVRYRGGKLGPVRNVAAGSGYWSQDSAAQILGLGEAPESIWVRWPGGKEQIVAVESNSTQIQIEFKP